MLKQAYFVLTVTLFAIGALSASDAAPASPSSSAAIPMKKDGGVYVVPVSVNGLVTVDCIVDSGASDVNIPTDVFQKLLRAGSIHKSDFVGTEEYTLADGSTERGRTFRIKSLKVGSIVVHNVIASIGGDGSSALLGQSFLERFGSWSLDNSHHTLLLVGPPSAAPPPANPDGHVATGPKPADGPSSVANGGGHAGGTPDVVARAPGGRSAPDGDSQANVPSREPADDRLTAQHSQ